MLLTAGQHTLSSAWVMQRGSARALSLARGRSVATLSARSRALADGGGRAAQVWEHVNGLAARPGMINMGQGFPDFPGSSVARRVASAAVAVGAAADNQYSQQPGSAVLRQSISNFVARRHGGTPLDFASEVVVTAGAQEALAAAFLAFLDPGDEVIIFDPCYPFMLGAIRLAGAVPKCVTLEAPGFAIDAAAVRAAAEASSRAKMLVLNTPHNPTGHVASAAELEQVAAVCREHDLLAVADEVYEHCLFGGATHRRLADVEGMRERTITLGSGGKLFALTGWRVAWATGPAALVQPLGQAHTHLTFSAPTPLQLGIAAALDTEDGLADVGPSFEENFAMLSEALLAGTPIKEVCAAQGGYFLVAETGQADVDFCEWLAEERGVCCTPMSVFYAEQRPCELVRFTICKSREHMERACEALRG